MIILSAWLGDMSVHRGNIGTYENMFWRIDFGGSFRNTKQFTNFFADNMQPLNKKTSDIKLLKLATQNYLRTQHPENLRESRDFVEVLAKLATVRERKVQELVQKAVSQVFHGFFHLDADQTQDETRRNAFLEWAKWFIHKDELMTETVRDVISEATGIELPPVPPQTTTKPSSWFNIMGQTEPKTVTVTGGKVIDALKQIHANTAQVTDEMFSKCIGQLLALRLNRRKFSCVKWAESICEDKCRGCYDIVEPALASMTTVCEHLWKGSWFPARVAIRS